MSITSAINAAIDFSRTSRCKSLRQLRRDLHNTETAMSYCMLKTTKNLNVIVPVPSSNRVH
jgi:hypothetical protein